MKFKNVAVVFMVKDLERTRHFYADALGIELTKQEGYLTGLVAGTVELVFFEGESTRGTSPQFVLGLEHGGIDTVAERLAARGVELVTPVTEAPGGWSLEFLDPDRHQLSLYQDAALSRRTDG